MTDRPNRLLSYSSITNLQSCQAKWHHRKILKTPLDKDYTQGDALAVGKTFHAVLENTLHDLAGFDVETEVEQAMTEHKVGAEWFHRLCAMVLAYDEMNHNSGMAVKICEMQILEENFLGYIDVIMTDRVGKWWIVDLKTAARWDKNLMQTLPYDLQMNLYSQRFRRIAADLFLDPNKFGGCRYRVTTKPYPAKRKKDESDSEYILRLEKGVTATDVVIPASVLAQHWVTTHEVFDNSVKIAKELKEGKVKPTKNYGNCMSYFRPCEYYSKCHGGSLFSDTTEVIYNDTETYFKQKQLEELL